MGTESEVSATQVTMDDLKSMESTMSNQISELCEMIVQLMQAKFPSVPPPPLEIPAPLNREEVGVEDEDADKNKGKDKEANSSTKGGGKGEYHHMPWYSPNPLVPHPHINNRGDPPKLDALNFSQ
jgi:hypothetical protein